ncbi:class I SAM-dependent methyltransferase [Chloroflexota bacterium]
MAGVFFDGHSFQEYIVLKDCPYCHDSVNFTEVAENPRTARCNVCGLYRLYPRINCQGQRVMLKKYNDEQLDQANFGEPLEHIKYFRGEIKKLKQVFPSVFPNGRVLDVGCGDGSFLAALKAVGAVATGVEPCEKFSQFGNQHGLDIKHGRFEAEGMPSGLEESSFDLICFRESIYYMPDLHETFDILNTYLRPGGGIYIKCHVATSWYYSLNNDYSSRYSYSVAGMPTRKALTHMLTHEGYRIRKIGYSFLSVNFYAQVYSKLSKNPYILKTFA